MNILHTFSIALVGVALALALPLATVHADTSTTTADYWHGFLFETELTAAGEVGTGTPMAATSSALTTTAHAGAWFAGSGRDLNYWLSAFSTESIAGAHFHCGAAGQVGPVVVNLLGSMNTATTSPMATSSTLAVNGEIGRGYVTDSDIASTGASCSSVIGYSIMTTQDLAKAIREGKIYANVHTALYPNGAARGQLMAYPGW